MKLFFERVLKEDELQLDPRITELADDFWDEARSIARDTAGYSAKWGYWLTDTWKSVSQPMFYKNNNKNSITYKMLFNSCEDHHKSVEEAVEKVKQLLNSSKYSELVDYLKVTKDSYGSNGSTQTYNFSLTLSASTEKKERTEKDLQKAARAKQIQNYFDKVVLYAVGTHARSRKKVSGGWICQFDAFYGTSFLDTHGVDYETGRDENRDFGVKPSPGWLSEVEKSIIDNFSIVSSKKAKFTPLFDVNAYEGKIIPNGDIKFSMFVPEPDDWSKIDDVHDELWHRKLNKTYKRK